MGNKLFFSICHFEIKESNQYWEFYHTLRHTYIYTFLLKYSRLSQIQIDLYTQYQWLVQNVQLLKVLYWYGKSLALQVYI